MGKLSSFNEVISKPRTPTDRKSRMVGVATIFVAVGVIFAFFSPQGNSHPTTNNVTSVVVTHTPSAKP